MYVPGTYFIVNRIQFWELIRPEVACSRVGQRPRDTLSAIVGRVDDHDRGDKA